jgi:hypothetical protein
MALTRAKKEQRIRIRKLIANYLETCTAWGKYFARPSQIVAAAKKMQMAGRIPYPVAASLRIGVLDERLA